MAKVAVLLGPDFQDAELRVPLDRLRDAGHQPEILGTKQGEMLRGKLGEEVVRAEHAVRDRSPREYDALVIPGGKSPAHLRKDADAVRFVKEFVASGKPVAAVCHGPQMLVEAGVVRGRQMTSWPEVRKELEDAGAKWVDREVVEDGMLITSRKPEDLEAFSRALLARLQGSSTSTRTSTALGSE
jgi:protease I